MQAAGSDNQSRFTGHTATHRRTYIVAEMACSHEGHPVLAHRLVDVCADANADAVQLQVFAVGRLVSPLSADYQNALRLEIPWEEWPGIISHAKDRGLHVRANVFDEHALDMAMNQQVDGLKLHSSDLSNSRMLDAVGSSGKPVSLAVGGSTLDEITNAVWRLRERGTTELLLMHGYQGYPTAPQDARLGFIRTLYNLFGCPVGYQDHTDGESDLALFLPLAAIGFGARVLEKHFTDDRSRRGTDYEAALGPRRLARFVKMVRSIDEAAGAGTVQPMSSAELKYRRTMKKTIVAARTIKAGEAITEDMLIFMRGEPGLLPSEAEKVLGKRTRNSIPQYATITLADVRSSQPRKDE